jgi:protein-disulfide isomerase
MAAKADRPRQTAKDRTAARRAAELEARRRERRRAQLWAGAAVAALVVVAVVVTVVVQSRRTDTADAPTPANTAAGTEGTAFVVGDPDAPVVVDVYEDYLCPACRAFEADAADTFDQLADDGDVQVRYHPVAILDRLSDDEYSTRAAGAAAVVADAAGVEAFTDFAAALFAQQPDEGGPGLGDEELIELAEEAGASGEEVAAGIRDRRFDDWVARATDEASQAGLPGTPWVLVDGEPLERPTGAALAAAVEDAR